MEDAVSAAFAPHKKSKRGHPFPTVVFATEINEAAAFAGRNL
jgi:hypothetical protein